MDIREYDINNIINCLQSYIQVIIIAIVSSFYCVKKKKNVPNNIMFQFTVAYKNNNILYNTGLLHERYILFR